MIDGYSVATWFERDRSHVEVVKDSTGATIAEWWDEDCQQLFVDGFLIAGPALARSAVEYCRHLGLIQ